MSVSDRPFTIGICGLIGSGKSTLVRMCAADGLATFDCDHAAKALYYRADIRSRVTTLLGFDPIDEKGTLRKREISLLLSSDPLIKENLEALIHHAVDEEIEVASEGKSVMIIESAILYSSGVDRYCDWIIAIDTDRAIRCDRVTKRDGNDDPTRFERIDHLQAEEQLALSRSDLIVHNPDVQVLKGVKAMIDVLIAEKK